ncbi:MAG: SgcJ/EcaC family oxidoreductase, partial [Solirubrobacteraceae bacterium]
LRKGREDMSTTTDASSEADAAVRDLLDRLGEAWAAGDPIGYAQLFTADAHYVAFDGTVMTGPDQIESRHAPLFSGIMKGSRLVCEQAAVRLVAPETAVVLAHGGIVLSWQRARTTPSRRRHSTLTLVAVRRGDRWAWTAFQNTRYRPFSQTLLGRLTSRLPTRPAAAPDGPGPQPGNPR